MTRGIVLAAAAALLTLAGCGGNDQTAASSSRTKAPSPSMSISLKAGKPHAVPMKPKSTNTKVDLPNIAMHGDGKTPILCKEWPKTSDDVQFGMARYALVKSQAFPADDARTATAQGMIKKDCAGEPTTPAYVVALREAMLLS